MIKLILTNALDAIRYTECASFTLRPLKGQALRVKVPPGFFQEGQFPRKTVQGKVFIFPENNEIWIGIRLHLKTQTLIGPRGK